MTDEELAKQGRLEPIRQAMLDATDTHRRACERHRALCQATPPDWPAIDAARAESDAAYVRAKEAVAAFDAALTAA